MPIAPLKAAPGACPGHSLEMDFLYKISTKCFSVPNDRLRQLNRRAILLDGRDLGFVEHMRCRAVFLLTWGDCTVGRICLLHTGQGAYSERKLPQQGLAGRRCICSSPHIGICRGMAGFPSGLGAPPLYLEGPPVQIG